MQSIHQRHAAFVAYLVALLLFESSLVGRAEDIVIDGPAVSGAVLSGQRSEPFEFNVTECRRIRLITTGVTQVRLEVNSIDDKSLSLDQPQFDAKRHSPDLLNEILEIDLPKGGYRVRVTHKQPGGVGEFKIRVENVPPPAEDNREVTASLRVQMGHNIGAVRSAAFSIDGASVVTVGTDASFLWKVSSGLMLREFDFPAICCDVSPDNRFVLLGSETGEVGLWDLSVAGKRWSQQVREGRISHLRFLTNSRFLVVAARSEVKPSTLDMCEIWDLGPENTLRRTNQLQLPAISSVGFEQRSQSLWLGTAYGSIWRTDASLDAPVEVVAERNSEISAIAVSPSQNELFWVESAHGQLQRSRLIAGRPDVAGKCEVVHEFSDRWNTYAFSRDATRLITGNEYGDVEVWETRTGRRMRKLTSVMEKEKFEPKGGPVRVVAASPTPGKYFSVDAGSAMTIWDVDEHGNWAFEMQWLGPPPIANVLRFNHDGSTLFGGFEDGSLRAWSFYSGRQKPLLHRHLDQQQRGPLAGPIQDLYIDRAASTVVARDDERVQFFDAREHERRPLLRQPPVRQVAILPVEPDLHVDEAFETAIDNCGDYASLLAYAEAGRTLAIVKGGRVRVMRVAGAETIYEHEHRGTSALAVSDDGTLLAIGDGHGQVTIGVPAGGSRLEEYLVGSFITGLTFAPDSYRLAVATKSGEIKVWDLNLNASRSDVYAANLSFGEYDKNASVGPILSLAFTADGQQLLCGGADHVAQLIDLRTGSVRAFRGHHGPIVSVAIPPKSDEGTRKIAVTGSRDRTCIVWDRETAQAICRLISLPNGDWFVVDSEGRFDANRLIYTDAPIAHWTFSDSPLATSDLALLQEHFFEPGLLPGALNSSRCEFADLPDLVDVNRAIPQVKIECVVPRDEHHADVYVRVGYGKHKVIRRGRKVTTTTKPYDLRLYRRGQLVGQFPPPKENPSSPMHDLDRWRKESDVLDGLEKQNGLQVDPAVLERLNNDLQGVVCFKGIALPTGKDGESWRMTAYAFNEEQMRSELATITARDASPREEIPTAYILSIGVDSYETPLRELNFAADDAIAFDREISKALQHMGHYQVVSVPLISARQKSHYASSANATKSNIEHVLKVLAGEPSKAQFPDLPQGLSVLKKATPDDVLIIFYAGHGFTASDGTFYVFPSNVGHRYLSLDGLLKSGHAISSHELSRWMQGVDVGRAALVVDACHSAGAVAPPGFKVGPFGSQGLGQLAYDKGIQVLAASQSNESAIEDQRFGGGHGLLTYTMLERLRQARQKFTLTDLFEYTRSNILLEYEEAKENRSSDRKVLVYDRAGDQISENQRGSGLPAVQEPALFDYQRRQDPIVLAPGEEASDRPSEQISNEVR